MATLSTLFESNISRGNGPAHIQLLCSSQAKVKEVTFTGFLYYSNHVSGSTFTTDVRPGAADYPHSEILSRSGYDYRYSLAGENTHLFIQARDSSGNKNLIHLFPKGAEN